MSKLSEHQRFEERYLKSFPGADLTTDSDDYLQPLVQAAWVGWKLRCDETDELAHERFRETLAISSPFECVFDAARQLLLMGSSSDEVSVKHTLAWDRLSKAFRKIQPDLSLPFPAFTDSMGSLDSVRAFDIIFSPASQSRLSAAENDRLLSMFEHGLIFAAMHPDARSFAAPLSRDGTSVFVDGAGMVPLDYARAQDLQHNPKGMVIEFGYTNYRGEYSVRRAIPVQIYQGSTDYHPHDQWLMEAFDLEKQANRVYAINDISHFVKGA
ncbi:hypothetical protein RYA05_02320 [Pseudomonas syringae pv. actinidiae]|nr:hypothetical protein [Pseudomonas syringae pv. actinidiae]